GLTHEAGLQTGKGVTHVAFDFGLGYQSRYRVDDNEIHRTGTYQRVGDFKGLFAGVGLRDEEVFEIDPETRGVLDIQGVLGIHKRTDTTDFLHFGDDLQGKRGFTGGFGAVDLDHPAAWQPANAQGDIQPQRARGDGLDVMAGGLIVAITHDRTLAKLPFDLSNGGSQRLGAFCSGRAAILVRHREPLIET